MDPVSAIGLADNCLSFANALYSYITIVASAKDDIQRVSGGLQATSVVLRDLGKLIEKYQYTDAWKGERMSYAQGCIEKAEKNIAKMKEMLLKTTASSSSAYVERDDIDLNKIQLLVFWPRRRSKLEERSMELAGSKTDILLAYMMYTAAAIPNSEEGQKAAAEIPALYRASRVAKRQIRKSRQRNKSFRAASRQHSTDKLPNNTGAPEQYEYDLDEEVLVYENEEDLRQDFEDWLREKEDRKREAEAKQKMLEEEAVEAWKKVQREKAQQQFQEVREQRAKLQAELEKQRLAPQQIRDTLDHLHPLPRHDADFALIAPSGDNDVLITDLVISPGPYLQKTESKQSIWSRLTGTRTRARATSHAPSDIPSVLQDPRRPGGLAEIAILLFEKVSTPSGQRIVQVKFDIDPQWLIHALQEMETRNKRADFDPALKEFATLPSEYRYAINDVTDSPPFNPDYNTKWVLVFVRCLKLGRSQSWFKSSQDRLKGVYVALKRATTITMGEDNDTNQQALREEPPTDADRDAMYLVRKKQEKSSMQRERYHSPGSNDGESHEAFEPYRASRARSRNVLRPHHTEPAFAETSFAKRANRPSQTRTDYDHATEDGNFLVDVYDHAYTGPTVLEAERHRPRSRERVRPRQYTHDTDGNRSRRQRTYEEPNYLPVVLAQHRSPYSGTHTPATFASALQPYSARLDPYLDSDYRQHRRRGDTYESVNTGHQSTRPMSERFFTPSRFPSGRQTTADSYGPSKHIRFVEKPQEIVIRRDQSQSNYQPSHRAQTPSRSVVIEEAMKQIEHESSSSPSDDEMDEIDRRLEHIDPSLSDARITQRLLSRFQQPADEERPRSASTPASFFGGAFSEEPGLNSPGMGSDGGNSITSGRDPAHISEARKKTVESVD